MDLSLQLKKRKRINFSICYVYLIIDIVFDNFSQLSKNVALSIKQKYHQTLHFLKLDEICLISFEK